MAGKLEKWALGSDFDGTATSKGGGQYRAAIQVVNQFAMDPEAHQARAELRRRYFDRAVDGTLSDDEGIMWVCEEADIFVRHKLEESRMRIALANMRLRPGAAEMLRALNDLCVPIGFVSFGIADFVEIVLQQHGIRAEVMALRLRWQGGKAVGWDPDSIVHPAIKGKWAARFAARHGVPYERLLCLGDSRGDRTLGLIENRLGIASDEADHAFLAGHFGEIVITEDYDPVRAWLRRRTGLDF